MPEVVDQMNDLDPLQLAWSSLRIVLKGALRKEEFILTRLKAALALEEERRKEAENKVAELEARMAKSVLEAMTWAIEEFKASFKMRNLNVKFGQEAFIKDFKHYEDRMARRFSKLDLSLLKEGKARQRWDHPMPQSILPLSSLHLVGPSLP
ncbi:hypothetical protein COCNU_scaffold002268G000010 [Cocos nucifera]|nr:hypothetical protein [Cocos nucifera]